MRGKKVWTIAVIAVLALAAAVPLAVKQEQNARAEQEQKGVRLLAINVGKADSLLLWAENKVYLIDTGTAQSWGALNTALNANSVKRLDGVFLTHTDKDHMGGMMKLAQSDIVVGAWYGSAMYTGIRPEKHPLFLAANERNTRPVWLRAGDSVTVSAAASFHVLGPIALDTEKENNNSLVMVLKTPDGSILFTGDMELEEESELMAAGSIEKCDILKVSHHGEDDSTSPAFARLVSPKAAVISTSSAEEPDTPSRSVLTSLKRAGAKLAITQYAKGGVLATLLLGQVKMEPVEWNLPENPENIQLAGMDTAQDTLTLANPGMAPAALKGWYVFSVKGDEIFYFPDDAVLAPGATARLGSKETPGACDWRFDDKNVWHNKKWDEAVLYDPYGRAVARLNNGLPEE